MSTEPKVEPLSAGEVTALHKACRKRGAVLTVESVERLFATIDAQRSDSARLNWLENIVREQNALLLHAGLAKIDGNYSGLAFREGFRSLRKAIDQARGVA